MAVYAVGPLNKLVGISGLFRLEGERRDLWHIVSRPLDEVAKRYLRRTYGRLVIEVAGKPDWTFPDDEPDFDHEKHLRLIDGPLCSAIDTSHLVTQPKRPQILKYVIATAEYEEWVVSYLQRPGEQEARFLRQVPWQR